jgi:hypothetical protein
MPKSYKWDEFRKIMTRMCKVRSDEWNELLKIHEELDQIALGIATRPMNLREGIVAYVLALLSTRSFRIATGGVYLAASGYPDLVPNLTRTSWEIGLRILTMQEDPIAAAYGYLLHGVTTEIGTVEAEIEHRAKSGEELGNLRRNLESLNSYRKDLEKLAIEQGRDPLKAKNKFGKLNVRQTCERLGIEKAYHVTYAWDSGFVHESNIASSDFTSQYRAEWCFDLGPLVEVPSEDAVDALRQCSFVLLWSADILGETDLADSARKCVECLHTN